MLYLTRNFGKPGDLFYSINDTKKNSKIIEKLCWDQSSFWPKVQEIYRPQLIEQKHPKNSAKKEIKNVLSEIDSTLFRDKFLANNEISIADISLAMNIDFVKDMVDGKFAREYPNHGLRSVSNSQNFST